jgi:uncharacterized membrane protein
MISLIISIVVVVIVFVFVFFSSFLVASHMCSRREEDT